jgi:hypothetical protein
MKFHAHVRRPDGTQHLLELDCEPVPVPGWPEIHAVVHRQILWDSSIGDFALGSGWCITERHTGLKLCTDGYSSPVLAMQHAVDRINAALAQYRQPLSLQHLSHRQAFLKTFVHDAVARNPLLQ